ncbi:MAG: hypothetical protein L6R35_005321 [Caloplaca aegaea]|nr:MAG: hypothetical protein L6R35_005321 [Caloplaca aegaea]
MRLPQVTLDTTLKELYGNSVHGPEGRIALVQSVACTELALSSKVRRNSKYLYVESKFCSTPLKCSREERAEIQRTVAIQFLALVPQRDAFCAGNMPIIIFDPDGSGKETAHGKVEAKKTMSNLTADQRSKILYFAGPKDISMEANGIDSLVARLALDDLEGYPLVMDLDTSYFLNSKLALSESGLPSPKSVSLELKDFSPAPTECCAVCMSRNGEVVIPDDCTGVRGRWLKNRIRDILDNISAQPIPFVLKNQQTFGGGGTFKVSSRKDVADLKALLSTRILPKLLSGVGPSNAHLKPATLILSEMVQNPICDWGLTFFVRRSGQCVYLSATQQILDPTNAWIGSNISYPAQDKLRQKFTPIMLEIGAWLHSYGYFGPCGADILEEAQGDHMPTTMKIVDLNVRTSGSLTLGLLKGHFSEQRGLHHATCFSISVNMPRESFIETFKADFTDGRIVIIGWYDDVSSGTSYGYLVVGATDEDDLGRRVAGVKKLASIMHF